MEWLIPEWLVALAVTLFVVDVFLMTEVLSWGGVLSLSIWLTWRISPPMKWAVLLFLSSLTLFSFGYWFLLRNTIGRMVRALMSGKAPKESVNSIVGQNAIVRIIDNKAFAFWNGELWPMEQGANPIVEGSEVVIKSFEGGIASI